MQHVSEVTQLIVISRVERAGQDGTCDSVADTAEAVRRVREEVSQARQRWYEGMRREKKAFLEGLRRRAGMYVYDTIRNVLADMADEELEERIVQVFVSKLRTLDAVQQDIRRVFSIFPRLEERQNQKAGTLSGGEQQMLAVGRAFMSGRKMMLLDEPSMGLAPLLMMSVFDSLKEINREGTTILLVEQNARLALQFAKRAYVLENGSLVMKGPSSELLHSPDVQKTYLGG